jgi:hypothetical protein
MARKPAERPRDPHPDPRIEAQLQRILSIRRMIAGKHELIDQDREQIASLRAKVEKHPQFDRAKYQREQIGALLGEVGKTEAEILKLHDEIGARLDEISDADLTAL